MHWAAKIKKYSKQLLLFVLGLHCLEPLFAQQEIHYFHTLSTAQNLNSGSYNYYIFKDSEHFVWISSVSGLNRFDGQRVKVYRDTSCGLSSTNIQGNFFEDSKKNLWFCSASAIQRYDRKHDHFEEFQIRDSINNGYRLLYLDTTTNDLLWVRIENELYVYPIDGSFGPEKIGDYNMPYKTQVLRPTADSPVSALSVSDAATDVIHVIRSGARGYVTKAIEGDDLVDAVRRVNDGDAVFSPRLAGFVLDAFSANLESPGNPELDELTAREQEVMRLLARGYAYKEIARRLTISIKTVESHASAVLRKLQLSSRNELAAWAANRKLV